MVKHAVYYNGKPVGWGQLERQGMYYVFRCLVRPPQRTKWRLWIRSGVRQRDLGVLVPEATGYGGVARFSVREFGSSEFRFELGKDTSVQKVEIGDESPVLVVKNLPSSRLHKEEGKYYLLYEGKSESSKPTGQ